MCIEKYREALKLIQDLKTKLDSFLESRVEIIQSEIDLGYEGNLLYHCLAIKKACDCPDYFSVEIKPDFIENPEGLWMQLKLLLESPATLGELNSPQEK